jgi:hypothetical protein
MEPDSGGVASVGPICPECAVGKCNNCAGFAINDKDDFDACWCAHRLDSFGNAVMPKGGFDRMIGKHQREATHDAVVPPML